MLVLEQYPDDGGRSSVVEHRTSNRKPSSPPSGGIQRSVRHASASMGVPPMEEWCGRRPYIYYMWRPALFYSIYIYPDVVCSSFDPGVSAKL